MSTSDPKPAAPVDAAATRARRRHAVAKVWGSLWLHLLLSAIAFFMFLPFLWMVLTGLKPLADVGQEDLLPSRIVNPATGQPAVTGGFADIVMRNWMFQNYGDVLDHENPDLNRRGIQFGRYYWNSIFIACWVTFLQVFTSALAAFSFSRLKWPGRDRVFFLYLATMMLPGLVMMIPVYQGMIRFGLVDSLAGLIIPASFSAFGTFLLRQFMLTIPSSLDEAAEIDGAGKWRLFWDVILPLSRPGLVTLAIFTFMGNFHSFFWPLVMLKTEELQTLSLGLMYFESSRGQSTHLLMAAVTMSVVPLVIVFIVLQRQLVKGIQLGAVKG